MLTLTWRQSLVCCYYAQSQGQFIRECNIVDYGVADNDKQINATKR
jgi:hypothetical protein